MSLEKLQNLYAAGALAQDSGQLDQAVDQFERVLWLAAKAVGQIRVSQNYWNVALPYLELAARDVGDLHIQYLLARAYRLHLRFEDALLPLQRALRGTSIDERKSILGQPEALEALTAIAGDLGGRLGRYAECVELYQLALEASPDDPALLNNLAVAYSFLGLFDEASRTLKRLVVLDGTNFLARCNLAMCYVKMHQQAAAIAEFETCDRLGYEGSEALGGLFEQKSAICSWGGLLALRERLSRALDDPDRVQQVALTTLQAHCGDAAALLRWTRKIAARAYTALEVAAFNCNAVGRTRQRIRIGYYSPHFYDNPVAHLTAGLFSSHDRSVVEVFIYAYGPDDGHPIRQRIADSVEHFLAIQGETEAQMAERIRRDEIDILVDLSANLGWSKPKTLIYRAAPIQVNWLGYIGTMGVPVYDYVIADNFSIPEGFDRFYSEKVVRLPHTFQSTDSARAGPSRVVSRQEYGLPEDAFVFSNCGQLYKIQPEMFEVWTRVLHAVPGAVLWLIQGPRDAEANLRKAWAEAGLSQDRLILSSRVSGEEHLARIGIADLFIDTYPYGSGTIANDVLWAGLPLLTLVGQTMVSRMAGSLLHAVGLPELIAHSHAEYEQKAVHLATHPEELKSLRKRLSGNKASWPLFDTPRFTRNLENAYQQMVARSRAGLPPAEITVLEGDVQ